MKEDLYKLFGGTSLEPEPGEQVVRHGAANLFRGIEAVGGWLWLTNRRLAFKSHKVNVQSGMQAWPLADIASVEPSRTFFVVPNGLLVRFRDGTQARFVVWGRSQWVSAVKEQLNGGARAVNA